MRLGDGIPIPMPELSGIELRERLSGRLCVEADLFVGIGFAAALWNDIGLQLIRKLLEEK